jgi:prolyl-tRNA editing enzyme YbaK/EbsC (Cys-tRNA(Pro) deacylase)
MRDQVRTSYRISSVAMVSKAIGGVASIGWVNTPSITLIDEALNDYKVVWAAAGHPHAVFPTSYSELLSCTQAKSMMVGMVSK